MPAGSTSPGKDSTEGTVHWAPAAGPGGWEIEVATPWRTSYGPALATSFFAGVYMAWRGESEDHQLHWTQFNGHTRWFDGPDQRLGGWSAAAPAMGGTMGHIYLAWRGDTTNEFDDPRLWWSKYDGTWAEQQPLDGWSTTGPGLASDGQSVYLAYTEQDPNMGHGQIFWSHTTDGGGWAAHQPLGSRKTYFTPAAA